MREYVLLVLLLSVLLLFGCATQPPASSNPPSAGTQVQAPTESQNKTPNEMAQACEDNTCRTALALQYENPSLCDSHDTDCYKALAVRYKNRGYCALASYSYRCYDEYDEAFPQGQPNETPGQTITQTQTVQIGQNNSQNKSLEKMFGECNSDASCIATLALQYENPALCARIPLSTEYLNIRYNQDRCYEALAVRYGKNAYCSLIYDSLIRNGCADALEK